MRGGSATFAAPAGPPLAKAPAPPQPAPAQREVPTASGACWDFAAVPVRASPALGRRLGESADLEGEADRVAELLADLPPPSGEPRAEPPLPPAGPPRSRPGNAPACVREVLAAPGAPLAAGLRRTFGAGLGHDLSSVRVHADAAADAAAASLGALAFTYGRDIGFRAGRFAPGTAAGRTLLAHELTHVVQQGGGTARLQLKGDPEKKPKKKPASSTGKYFSVRVTGPLTSDELLVEFVRQYLRVGLNEAREIAKRWSWGTDAEPPNAAQIAAKSYLVDISHLSVPKRSATQDKGSVSTGSDKQQEPVAKQPQAGTDEATRMRQAIDALPDDVAQFLFSGGATKVEPPDFQIVLDIAAKVAAMSPEQRAEYKSRVSAETVDWKAYGQAIDAFLKEVGEREGEAAERRGIEARLQSPGGLYERYRTYSRRSGPIQMSPSFGGPVSTGPTKAEIEAEEALKADLAAAGFTGGIKEFATCVSEYQKAFARDAARLLEVALDQYLHMLMVEEARYRKTDAAGQLFTAVSATGAAGDYKKAGDAAIQSAQLAIQESHSAWALASKLASQSGEAEALAEAKVLGASASHPLVQQQGFDREGLAGAANKDDVLRLLLADIEQRRASVATLKEKLSDPSLIFGNDQIFENSLKAQDVIGKPVLEAILRGHKKELFWKDLAIDVGVTLLGIILGILTQGAGFAALLVSAGEVAYDVKSLFDDYQDYQRDDAAYDVGQSSEPGNPSSLILGLGVTAWDLRGLRKSIGDLPHLKTGGLETGGFVPVVKATAEESGEAILKGTDETSVADDVLAKPVDDAPLPPKRREKLPNGKLPKKPGKKGPPRKLKKKLKRQAEEAAARGKEESAKAAAPTIGKAFPKNTDALETIDATGQANELLPELVKEAIGHLEDAREAIEQNCQPDASKNPAKKKKRKAKRRKTTEISRH